MFPIYSNNFKLWCKKLVCSLKLCSKTTKGVKVSEEKTTIRLKLEAQKNRSNTSR